MNEEKQKIINAYKEMLGEATMGPIEGNWKKVASLFQNIFSQLTMLENLGVYKDKKYGKRLKKIDTALEDLAEELDDEFGG
jgi:hypothetical protein